ncbi:alpha/beta fold hydrolase [Neorhizobium galegae]|uniref:Pimelyl-[acyl-carrier protein] methyl ester esterase n=1 Tax=Neorhizobium galegae bv. orientalis str. HAMBI 540 TaxID=1028800 RepID=A0A068T1I9_NEOGA|nr:alpha/beta hydrolase [Neorhizobium galegae]MCQ1854575.1 alpha/beta hydrolase [Neorhizobium galegae]CDN51929.1 Pimelyl-[acyl-carrier protein] methyl ester esterase [Neorhizobium galegae bv. orientalis str. HAMBI 540]CDZ51566.1 Pimelyl-[acyl-carrier protein] methyl ester esterase [Neorhizobium galegae bv. orientalis]
MAVFDRTIDTRHGSVRISDTMTGAAPLVMIHGSGSSRHVFARQLQSHLSRNWRLIAIDLPGHGESSDARDPQSTYTVTGLADCIGEVAARLGLHRFPVFGWSLGGHVAVEMAGSGKGISGLMLCGTPPVSNGLIGMLRGFSPSFDILLASKQSFTSRDVERFQSLCFGGTTNSSFQDAIARSDGRLRAIFSRTMLRGQGIDQRRTVEQADIPIALVNGSRDPFVKLSYLSGLNIQLLFEGKAHVMEGVGHAPFWENPESFNSLLERFLQTVVAHEAKTVPADMRDRNALPKKSVL